jgi:uncharacterized protein
MSNKHIIQQYMDSYNKLDGEAIHSLLAEDIEWVCPGAFHLKGKNAVDHEISHHEYDEAPQITVIRMIEEGNVVIAEGTVRAKHKGQDAVHLLFCDVFEIHDGKIRKLTSYLGPAAIR